MMLIDIIEKILSKSPLKVGLVRNLSCLDPNKMANEPDSCTSKFKSILVKLASTRKVNAKDCDSILDQFKEFINDDVIPNKSRFAEFQRDKEDRIDIPPFNNEEVY